MAHPPVVAVIDDDVAVCKAVRRLLVASGLDTTIFHSGQCFLDWLPDNRPDCVVLDYHMPGLTGLDVLRKLHQARSNLPVIVVTGRSEVGSEALCQAAGASAYLSKPIDDVVLLRTVGHAISNRE